MRYTVYVVSTHIDITYGRKTVHLRQLCKMNKIIPIISICVAALDAVIAVIGLVSVAVSTAVVQLALVAIPTAIVGAVVAVLSIGINALFLRDKLCRIAFFINVGATVVSLASVIIWLTAL